MSWLNYLNAIEGTQITTSPATTPPNGLSGVSPTSQPGFLSDELRAQLEAWTTVNFDSTGAGNNSDGHPSPHDGLLKADASLLDLAGDDAYKSDPSPYSKRPFGVFQHQYYGDAQSNNGTTTTGVFQSSTPSHPSQLQALQAQAQAQAQPKSFNNAFAGSNDYSRLFDLTSLPAVAVDGSNTLFAAPASPVVHSVVPSPPAAAAPTPASSNEPNSKKRRTSTRSSSITPDSVTSSVAASPVPTAPTPSRLSSTPSLSSAAVINKPLTKAAILAAQAAELQAQKVSSQEEELARQAELNRIAAEDDKRRRNTAASARFRVKKKQREAALEDTVKELNGKIEKLEKELESSRSENNFLRDLVIKRIGGGNANNPSNANSPSANASGNGNGQVGPSANTSSTSSMDLPIANQPFELFSRSIGADAGKISGGQEGATGMGTFCESLHSYIPAIMLTSRYLVSAEIDRKSADRLTKINQKFGISKIIGV